MSQLLIAQGDDSPETKALFERGVEAFEKIYQLHPADSVAGPADSVAVFPNYQGKASPVHRPATTPGWICGAGCWFFEGVAGEAALRRMGQRPRDAAGQWLGNIDGTFALALRDGSTGKLVVVTDRLGTLHVYTARLGSAVLICTSSLVLAAAAFGRGMEAAGSDVRWPPVPRDAPSVFRRFTLTVLPAVSRRRWEIRSR